MKRKIKCTLGISVLCSFSFAIIAIAQQPTAEHSHVEQPAVHAKVQAANYRGHALAENSDTFNENHKPGTDFSIPTSSTTKIAETPMEESSFLRITSKNAGDIKLTTKCSTASGYIFGNLIATVSYQAGEKTLSRTYLHPKYNSVYAPDKIPPSDQYCKQISPSSSKETDDLMTEFYAVKNEDIFREWPEGKHSLKPFCYKQHLDLYSSAADVSQIQSWKVGKTIVNCP